LRTSASALLRSKQLIFDETIAQAGPATRVMPGHGPDSHRDGLIAQRALSVAGRDRVAAMIANGKI
jgi:glyoxylase-like metal-dependent hydrolase (beta-lactamase superfamily II)